MAVSTRTPSDGRATGTETPDLRDFYGPNAGYVLDLYERYRRDPTSVAPADRALFERWTPRLPEQPAPPAAPSGLDPALFARAAELADAIRLRGHLAAHLDPLGRPRPPEPSLDLATHGLTEEALAAMPPGVVGGPLAARAENALAAIQRLRDVYCGTTGYEFAQVADPTAWAWLRDAVETGRYAGPADPAEERALLRRLTQVETFERFLHRAFPGQTRFSVEGTDMLVPMLDDLVEGAAEADVCEVLIGMAHRGRLNVLAHVLGKPYSAIIAEFHGAVQRPGPSPQLPDAGAPGWAGDVKYHLGGRRAYEDGRVVRVLIKLAPNPSHLELVDPVVEGMARAAEDDRRQPGTPRWYENAALPILIHGDTAFTGEGIVSETLNLSRLPGYRTGGTVHLIANNQLGFTTEPEYARSTRYASDPAKGFEIPVVHVNADDPRACIAAVRLALAYRQRFRSDFLVDLVGYRRWGHNEGDEPLFTQPLMYDLIARHPTVRELWANDLVARGVVSGDEAARMVQEDMENLQLIRRRLAEGPAPAAVPTEQPPEDECGPQQEVETAVPADRLAALNASLNRLPAGFTAEPKLARLLGRRAEALGPEGAIDWAHAETLAFASILADGTPIRLTGQDTVRGTFSQRHAVLYDRQTGRPYSPLQALPEARASFDVQDSPLSEAGALGFEYGYSVEAPDALVVWEAQYGDFVDVAQPVIDRFVISGRTKWGQTSSLVLLLPHGYEGQGPEHSSAQPERFLELAAANNIVVAYPSTAAQYFHLLRRQAALLRCGVVPLVALTPKSLLRSPRAAARLSDLTEGTFRPVIDDASARERAGDVTRLILCSGKVYFDLTGRGPLPEAVAVVRLEQLYPFPRDALAAVVGGYPSLREVVWLQEEPRNMGAWSFVAPRLRELIPARVTIAYAGRPAMASPAEGSPERHAEQQARLLEEALAGVTQGAPAQRPAGGLGRAS